MPPRLAESFVRWCARVSAIALVFVAAACTSDESSDPTTPAAHVAFHATVQQQRLDVGTRRIGLELTSDADTNLLLERPADGGSGRPVQITGVLGSVILDVEPRAAASPSWGRLPRGQSRATVPIEFRAGRTCTAHGRSGTQQPFIFSAYVHVGDAPLYRQIIEPPKALQRQALALLDDVC